jgi:NADP-dependent aldehyde dehydrogenase
MVRHPATAAVGFTGSHAAGRALFDAAATRAHPIPVFAEMSSLNPVFLLPEAVRERGAAIAQGLLGSFTLGVGQFCTKPGLVFVQRGADTDAFLGKLAEVVQSAPSGTMLTPGIREAFLGNRRKVTSVAGVKTIATGSAEANETRTEAEPSVAATTAAGFLAHPELATEAFGPFTLIVIAEQPSEMAASAAALDGQLTATLHGTPADLAAARGLVAVLEQKSGRLVVNGFPTGVEVSPAMNHGGPYPATSDTRFTSVGTAAILRFARPVCYQGFADGNLPPALQNENPLGLMRLVNGTPTRDSIRV